jgi:hypothetical protein
VKFSLWTSNSHAWPELVDLATYIESVGWHGFWLPDHFMSNTTDDSPGPDAALDCWTALAAIAFVVMMATTAASQEAADAFFCFDAAQSTPVDKVAPGFASRGPLITQRAPPCQMAGRGALLDLRPFQAGTRFLAQTKMGNVE